METQGYNKITFDNCVFVQRFSIDDFIILLLYVDNMLIVDKKASRIYGLKKQSSEFLIKNQFFTK